MLSTVSEKPTSATVPEDSLDWILGAVWGPYQESLGKEARRCPNTTSTAKTKKGIT